MEKAEDVAVATLAGMNMEKESTLIMPSDAKDEQGMAIEKDGKHVLKRSIPGATRAANLKQKRNDEDDCFPVQPHIIQVIKKPRTHMNHSYRDFSLVPSIQNEPAMPTNIDDMSFPQKVHDILRQEVFQKWVSWLPHGRAFRVIVPVAFEKNISEKYFGHKRYSSFLRQLSNHHFKHVSQGPDRNCYYHEFMLRGLPHLCKYMPTPKDARRLIADPQNEPNFYEISKKYPLPDDPEYGKGETSENASKNATAPILVDPQECVCPTSGPASAVGWTVQPAPKCTSEDFLQQCHGTTVSAFPTMAPFFPTDMDGGNAMFAAAFFQATLAAQVHAHQNVAIPAQSTSEPFKVILGTRAEGEQMDPLPASQDKPELGFRNTT